MNPRYAFIFLRILVVIIGLSFAPGSFAETTNLPIAIDSKLALWLRADRDVITNTAGFVSRWNDQSLNGNHAVQSNSISMPELKTGPDGQPLLHFNGLTNFLEIPHSASLIPEDLALFAVVRVEDFSQVNGLLGKASRRRVRAAPFEFFIQQSSGRPYFSRGQANRHISLSGTLSVTAGQWMIVSVVAHRTNVTMYLNGVFNGSANITYGPDDLERPMHIGSQSNFEGMLKGDLAEIIYLRAAVSEAERTALHDYLGKKYGIDIVRDLSIDPHPTVQRLEGQTASLVASAISSSATIRYQWQRNEEDIPDATNAVYTTPNLTLADNNSRFRARISTPRTNQYNGFVTLNVVPDIEPLTATTAAFLLRDQSQISTNADEGILPPYSSRLWQPGENSFRNAIQSIAQTSDGFLWIATQGGLARFDGEQFEFVSLNASSNSENKRVNAICTTDDGSLWAGSDKGLFQLRKGEWIAHPLPAGSDETILSLQRSRDHSLWIGTRAGVALYQNEKLSLPGDKEAEKSSLQKQIAIEPIRSISENGNGDLYFCAGNNLIRLHENQAANNDNFSAFKSDFLRSVCPARDSSVWVGGNSGLIRFKDGKYQHYSKTNGLPDNTVSSIYEDRRGNLWIGTYGGLCRFTNEKFVTELTPLGEPYDQILCFFEDRENNLWVGAKNGLYQLSVQQFITYTTRHGLAHNNVISVYGDDEDAIWIGTWGGGLHCLSGGKITIYSATKSKVMHNDLILALQGARDGGIWFGEDYEGGLYRLQNGEFQFYGRAQGLGRGAIRTLLEDKAGRLLIGSASSYLSVLEKGKITSYGANDGLPSNSNRCLLQAQDGRIWVGTQAGLCCWTNGGFATFTTKDGLSDNTVFSLHEDQQQSLWIGTAKGLNRLNQDHFTFYPRQSGMPDEAVLEILEDDFAHLWLATRSGVVRVSKKELAAFDADQKYKVNLTLFGKADGMASQVCVGAAKPSACKSKDGRLWFATTQGLAVTDPKLQISKNEKPPPVVFKEVISDKSRVLIPESKVTSPTQGSRLKTQDLVLKPGRGELEFHYTALSLTAPEKNRFKYKLEGLDSDWVDADTRHMAFYNNVPPGNYTFHVIACNNDGVWNLLGENVKFSILPHYWQTWWFKMIGIIASVAFVGATVRYGTKKRMEFKLERLQQQHAVEKERTRIARDMHDDVGATLTQISVLSQLAEKEAARPDQVRAYTSKITDTSRELAQSMDEIVWAVNPKNDSLRHLVGYIFRFAEEFLYLTELRLRKERPKVIPDVPFPAEVRHNVFLVVKEAINNIVKHSGASEVRLSLDVTAGELVVHIEDNGHGFSPESTDSFGNGLENMRKRIADIGARMELSSTPEGTRIKLTVPLPVASA